MRDMKDEQRHIFRMENGDSPNLEVSCIHFCRTPGFLLHISSCLEKKRDWVHILLSAVFPWIPPNARLFFILSSVTYHMLCLFLSLSAVSCPAF